MNNPTRLLIITLIGSALSGFMAGLIYAWPKHTNTSLIFSFIALVLSVLVTYIGLLNFGKTIKVNRTKEIFKE